VATPDTSPLTGPKAHSEDTEGLDRENRFKDELIVHLAKSTLDSGAKLLDRLAGTVASISGTLLAAYIAVLGFLKPSFESFEQMIPAAIPAVIWLITLPVSLFLTLPHKERFDLKIPSEIADAGSRGLTRQLMWAKAVLFLMLVGIGFAIGVILSFEYTGNPNASGN
jgi:hypothetical protein